MSTSDKKADQASDEIFPTDSGVEMSVLEEQHAWRHPSEAGEVQLLPQDIPWMLAKQKEMGFLPAT